MSGQWWQYPSGAVRPRVLSGFANEVTPTVVIDPADIPHLSEFADDPREALEIIADGVRDIAGGDLDATENLVRWLAEQMPKPPKPAEPTGLGAVVEDADGGRWLRVAAPDLGGGVWIGEVFNGCGDPQSTQYDNVPAVRVLSEGVTA